MENLELRMENGDRRLSRERGVLCVLTPSSQYIFQSTYSTTILRLNFASPDSNESMYTPAGSRETSTVPIQLPSCAWDSEITVRPSASEI